MRPSDEFHKVTVSVRPEPGYGEPDTYAIMVMRNNHGSVLYPSFLDRKSAELVADQLQVIYDQEQEERHDRAEESHRRLNEQLQAQAKAERQRWEGARVRNTVRGAGRLINPRYDQLATVVEYRGHKLKVRYDDGRTVQATRSNFELVE